MDSAARYPFAPLVPALLTLIGAQELDDVREAIAHGARLISPAFVSLCLYEQGENGALEATLVRGGEARARGAALELELMERAVKTGVSASTLDRDQAGADDFVAHGRLCLVRPLRAYGDVVGAIAFQYGDRIVLDDAEFAALRKFCEFAAAALSFARVHADLNGYAFTDPLTGLANRRRLELEFERLTDRRLALLLIDFDGLKTVNDTLGYEAGDRLIAAIGAALSGLAKPDEVIVRWGGDEFVILIEGVDAPYARERADEITQVLDRLALPSPIDSVFHGASVGWATVDPDEQAAPALARAALEMRLRKRRRKSDREVAGPRAVSE